MSENKESEFLYLTTIGRVSGKPHQIEIWFVEYQGNYYLISENGELKDWVKNLTATPNTTFSVGSRDAEQIDGMGRVVDPDAEPELAATIRTLMDTKYHWSDGLIVELKPRKIRG